MITLLQPLPVGNAVRLFFEPPPLAVEWKVLRKPADTFTGHDDAGALLVHRGSEKVVVDSENLPNEAIAFYRVYSTDDGEEWTASATAYTTPRATYSEATTDVQACVRSRLEAGLKIECERGTFITDNGYIPVFTEFPMAEQEVPMPLVTVHLENEASGERGLGEDLGADGFDLSTGEWTDTEGWMADVRLTIVGWSLNGDERSELRRAIRRIVIANLGLFDSKGFIKIDLSHKEDFNTDFGAPIFQSMTDFSCSAPVIVGGNVRAVREVEAHAHPYSNRD